MKEMKKFDVLKMKMATSYKKMKKRNIFL